MTDTNPSGETIAPAADTQAPATFAATPAVSFGSTRGSGLARGKRPSGAAAPAAAPVKSDYKPTSLAIITPEREYKNPFASPEPASLPAEEPAKVEAPIAEAAPVAVAAPAPVEQSPTPVEQSPAPVEQPEQEPLAERSEIQILPPAESVRPAVSWESPSALRREPSGGERTDRPQRDDRPTFRPDRREDRAGTPPAEGGEPRRDSFRRDVRQHRDPRDPRDPRDARQPRDPREARQPRDPRDFPQREQRPAQEPAVAQKQGFFGWLKGLFGGKPAEVPAPSEGHGDSFGGGHRHRRRHRGGRGGNPAFRGDRFSAGGERQPGGEPDRQGGDHPEGGHRRRRHRGGRGRDRGGDHRSQGAQGGGAI